MPISRFTQLAQTLRCDNKRENNSVLKFKVYCIVLHKSGDFMFVDHVKRDFLTLNKNTGKDMLFMSFFNPPIGWIRGLDYWANTMRNLSCERVANEEQLLDCFKSMLPLNAELPVIMVSTDLRSDSVILLKTDADLICRQLVEIGGYASGLSSYVDMESDDAFRHFLSDIGECVDFRLPNSLSGTLLDIVAANAIATSDGFDDERAIKEAVRSGVQRRQKRMDDLERDIDNNRTEWERASLDFSSFRCLVAKNAKSAGQRRRPTRFCDDGELFARRAPRSSMSLGFMQMRHGDYYEDDPEELDLSRFLLNPRSRDMRQFEYESRMSLLHYNKELKYLQSSNSDNLEDYGINGGIKFYFKSPALDLYNMLSIEIEASLEQSVRQMYGIEMPEYFRQYCDGVDCFIYNGRKDVDFNRSSKGGRWIAPSLGDAIWSIRHLDVEGSLPKDLSDNFLLPLEEIIDQALVVNNIRNYGVGHSGLVSSEDFEPMYNAFMTFWSGFFDCMFLLKDKLKSGR